MRTKRISIISLIAAAVVAFSLALLGEAKLTLANTDPVFAFESGAYVKLSEDGGLRFRLQMDENTATEIKANAEETLYFYVASAERMAEVTDGEGAKALFTAGNAWEVEVDKAKIYAGKDGEGAADGYYYANVLLDINTLGASNGAYYTTDFVAAATLFDGNEYTSFVKSVHRSLQETASAGALRGGFYEEIAETYAWLGTEYPMVAKTAEDYQALLSAADIDSLYYVLDGVEDTEGLAETYGTAMISGGAANGIQYSDYAGYYQSWAALTTDLDVGTVVEVQMDVYVTGSFEGEESAIKTVDTVYTPNGGEANEGKDITALVTGESGWHTITFLSTVRNFDKLRYNLAYGVQDTSSYVNGIYIISNNKSLKSFNYKNVEITAIGGTALRFGGANKMDNGFYQSVTGLQTALPVGTTVNVTMDIYITGSFNEYSSIYLVDSVWSADGGERNAASNIKSTIVTGESGWHTVTFTATVRNFPCLRHNSNYNVTDTSEFGNAVYLLTENNSAYAFNYKNVEMTVEMYSMRSGGARNPANGFYQSMTGLQTDLAVGTTVTVDMDVYITGSFNEYSSIYCVDSVYSVEGGERKTSTNIKTTIVTGEEGWHHVTFFATVRNFPNLRLNSAYTVTDTSEFGNAVYLLTENNSAAAFNYKNVVITEMYSLKSGGANTKGNGFYQSMTGLKTDLDVGTTVTVKMDVYVTGTFNEYSRVCWVNDVYTVAGGESDKSRTNITSTIVTGEEGWQHVTFTATVRNFPNLRYNSGEYNITDTSEYGNAVYLITQNKSETAFNYRNVVITAA